MGTCVGLPHVTGRIRGPTAEQSGIDLLIECGPTRRILPHDAWTAIGLAATRRPTFTLADATKSGGASPRAGRRSPRAAATPPSFRASPATRRCSEPVEPHPPAHAGDAGAGAMPWRRAGRADAGTAASLMTAVCRETAAA